MTVSRQTPDDGLPDPPRIGSAKKRAEGRRRKLTPEKRKARNQRIEEVRTLMSLNYSDGDLKRMLAERWAKVLPDGTRKPMRPRSVEQYLTVARERQRELLGRPAPDARADSLDFWRRKQQEAQGRAAQGREEMRLAQESIKKAEAVLDDHKAKDEAKEIAAIRLKAAVTRQDHARRTIWAAEQQVREDQGVIDKLLGNHAPVKLARTTPEGEAVDKPAAPEPEPTDPNKTIEDLAEQLRKRAQPSAN